MDWIFKRKTVLLTLSIVAVAAVVYWSQPEPVQYLTAQVERGELVQSVSANGTLNPVTLVNVGTQVSGVVKKIHVDFNDKVEKGQVLLELDSSLHKAQLAQSQAMVTSALAAYQLAQANHKRTEALFAKKYVSKQDVETSSQTLKTAGAQLKQARAQADRDRINLEYTVIRSPVSGVVVSREVDVGQTVAASFQTPTLYKIAQDLTRMQIDSSFAEADIGTIREGQLTRFTVDAFPNREFSGVVRQLRLNPTTQQNVVTYNVVIDVHNDDGILLPGMTAYVSVITARLSDVLQVPNAALRFRPAADAELEEDVPELDTTLEGMHATVYTLSKHGLQPVRVLLGASDNNYTEIRAGAVSQGDALVVDVAVKRQSGMRVH